MILQQILPINLPSLVAWHLIPVRLRKNIYSIIYNSLCSCLVGRETTFLTGGILLILCTVEEHQLGEKVTVESWRPTQALLTLVFNSLHYFFWASEVMSSIEAIMWKPTTPVARFQMVPLKKKPEKGIFWPNCLTSPLRSMLHAV